MLIGGLDNALAKELQTSITDAGVTCQVEGHAFPATDPDNICNRGRRKVGVQLELSLELRQSPNRHRLETAVRKVLLQRAAAKGPPSQPSGTNRAPRAFPTPFYPSRAGSGPSAPGRCDHPWLRLSSLVVD